MITVRLVFGTMLCLIIFSGCRKQIEVAPVTPMEPFVSVALAHLREQLPEDHFRLLSTDNYVYLNNSSAGLDLVRFFIKGDISRSITVVKDGTELRSTWLSMKDPRVSAPDNRFTLSGIAGDVNQDITVVNGHVAQIVSGMKNQSSVINIRQAEDHQLIEKTWSNGKVDPEGVPQWLPEFTLLVEIGGLQRPVYSLYWLTNMNSAYLYAYTNLNPYEPIDMGGVVSAPGEAPSMEGEIVLVPELEFEKGEAIDLAKALKCFDNVPSDGANYSMTLYADIPVNNDASQLANGLSPGHSFISMTKSNGLSTVTQVFGFYPAVGFLSVFNSAVKGKVYDNSEHEYDASITIENLDEYSFNAAGYLAKYFANGMHYDLNDFNCTDFAMEIFNKAMPLDDQLVVQDWQSNVLNINYGTTPNALYQTLAARNSGGKTKTSVGTANAKAKSGGCQ